MWKTLCRKPAVLLELFVFEQENQQLINNFSVEYVENY